ncbi:MAG: GAF domain-containing protein [Planctomycetota bacterium]|nr:GAF domain-containing protein [Planctomycetota bacterium]
MLPSETARRVRSLTGPIGTLDANVCSCVEEVIRAIREGASLEVRFRQILDAAVEVAEAERGFLILTDREDERVAAARSCDREDVSNPEGKVSRTLLRLCHEGQKAVVVTDASIDDRLADEPASRSLHMGSSLCVPVIVRGKVVGSLFVVNRFRSHAFGQREVEILQGLAGLLGDSLEGEAFEPNLLEPADGSILQPT